MSSKSAIVIAIDGPSASGKSTVARIAAVKLGFNYVDSGSFYRGITWKALREGIETTDSQQVVALINRIDFQCFLRDGSVQFTIDGEEPGDQIRSQPVQEHVSDIAAVPEVRTFLVNMLRETARLGSLAMEGRDIGTVVFPDSPFKYYLDADPEERARRRYNELAVKNGYSNVGEVFDSLARRDRKDTTRKAAPLQIALGAKVIDSTGMEADQVVDLILNDVRAHTAGK
ncbi:MAG TPA: (d)CMP kinase [Kiritimatiellia bacterium]|nr:(d)CMP kinase [Kiritimatiellia bacterium]HMP35388.1 (d)CMP kinase [Kiritimatiellia bacterium]